MLAARTWDLVVVLVVGQTAGHQEQGWSTGYLFVFTSVLLNVFLLEAFTTHLTVYCWPQIFFPWILAWIHLLLSCLWKEYQNYMELQESFSDKALGKWIYVINHVEKTFRAVKCQMCGIFFL